MILPDESPRAKQFWARVQRGPTVSCWPWTGCLNNGYGWLTFRGRQRRSSQVAFELTHGLIPKDRQVLHRCDNRLCCNPAHLYLGTPLDNSHDCLARGRGRWATGESHHRAKLTEAQVLEIRRLRSEGISLPKLGRMFGVATSTVYDLVRRKSWRVVA